MSGDVSDFELINGLFIPFSGIRLLKNLRGFPNKIFNLISYISALFLGYNCKSWEIIIDFVKVGIFLHNLME